MALFSNKIIDARYMNAEYSIVEILYTHDDGLVYSHALEVDENSSDWKDLQAEGWSGEKLIESTAEYKRAQSHAYNLEVNESARKIAQEMLGTTVLIKEKSELDVKVKDAKIALDKLGSREFDTIRRSKNAIFQFLWDADDNKDELFKFKLWALELDFVKTADKSVKSSLRKAKTIIDGLVILKSIK